jgi:molybdenum cofactor guanylyltransferase
MSSREELNLFLPVDLPLLPIEFLQWMTDRARQTNALATIPHLLGRAQPLCAIYSRALLHCAQAALAAGDGKVMRAIEAASVANGSKIDAFDVETIFSSLAPSSDWPQSPPAHRWFNNLNTPEDIAGALLEELPSIH